MAIQVVCPGCHKRFKVSDKFAGKKGPCPSCKKEIVVPSKDEEVVVHAPEQYGPKTASGKGVLKPISRTETRLSPLLIVGIIAGVLLVLVLALLIRGAYPPTETAGPPLVVLAAGAVLLAPAIVLGGYSFLRNDELEPHRGVSLGVRVAICAVAYAGLWALLEFVALQLGIEQFETPHVVFIIPALLALGGGAAHVTLDLDYGNGLLHYGFYLLVTVLLRLLVGLPPL